MRRQECIFFLFLPSKGNLNERQGTSACLGYTVNMSYRLISAIYFIVKSQYQKTALDMLVIRSLGNSIQRLITEQESSYIKVLFISAADSD